MTGPTSLGDEDDDLATTRDTTAALAEVRARVDAMAPRVHRDGAINASHVAIEQTLRNQRGLPSYSAELDGPGKYRDPCRHCGSQTTTDVAHLHGERKCCPDCDHRPLSDPQAALADVLGEMVTVLRERIELVTHLQEHRAATLRALRAHPDGSGGDYWRWQGHAELSRQLLERLGAEVPQ